MLLKRSKMISSNNCMVVFLVFISQLTESWTCKPGFLMNLKPFDVDDHAVHEETHKNFNISKVKKEFLPQCHCGTPPDKTPRIAGGEEADKFEFPWQAALVYRNTRVPFCAGTLINNWYILTAAHCVLNLPKILMAGAFNANSKPEDFLIENDFQVLLSAHKLNPLTQNHTVELFRRLVEQSWDIRPEDEEQDFEEGTLRFDISKKIFHHGFVSEYRKFGFDYDIALLRLKKPVNLTDRNAPTPICLPHKTDFNRYEGLKATTIGWGRTNFRNAESGSPVLKKIQMPVYSLEECAAISGVAVSSRFICAGHQTKKKDIGKTDSGGPLLIKNGNRVVQIGIVSWGAGERDGSVASAFTRITEFLPWIYSKLKSPSRASSTNLLWCSETTKPKLKPSADNDSISSNEINEISTTTEVEMESTTDILFTTTYTNFNETDP